ncbi:hypothetical protein RRG08_056557 [Elysia crispata]|uniref:Uncharacterized protein n=1 Tax=Elysia crispata TaxID=231223 RepID=A0AAE0YEI6_9GAST|nr:hypothetical protein RRG08_056557 [Elysia crispata]
MGRWEGGGGVRFDTIDTLKHPREYSGVIPERCFLPELERRDSTARDCRHNGQSSVTSCAKCLPVSSWSTNRNISTLSVKLDLIVSSGKGKFHRLTVKDYL